MSDLGIDSEYGAYNAGAYAVPGFNSLAFPLAPVVGNPIQSDWTVPEGSLALVQAGSFTVVADATVGTRQVILRWTTPELGVALAQTVNSNAATAGTTTHYDAAVGWPITYAAAAPDASTLHVQLPWLILYEGCKFGVALAGAGGAGDVLQVGTCIARVWPRPASFMPALRSYAAPPVLG